MEARTRTPPRQDDSRLCLSATRFEANGLTSTSGHSWGASHCGRSFETLAFAVSGHPWLEMSAEAIGSRRSRPDAGFNRGTEENRPRDPVATSHSGALSAGGLPRPIVGSGLRGTCVVGSRTIGVGFLIVMRQPRGRGRRGGFAVAEVEPTGYESTAPVTHAISLPGAGRIISVANTQYKHASGADAAI